MGGGEEVDAFLKESIQNDYFAKVYDYFLREIPLKEDEDRFTVRF